MCLIILSNIMLETITSQFKNIRVLNSENLLFKLVNGSVLKRISTY